MQEASGAPRAPTLTLEPLGAWWCVWITAAMAVLALVAVVVLLTVRW